MNQYQAEGKLLLAHLRSKGAKIVGTQEDSRDQSTYQVMIDGESDLEILDRVFPCDDGLLYVNFTGSDQDDVWIRLIVGNSWGELVSDHKVDDDLEDALKDWMVDV